MRILAGPGPLALTGPLTLGLTVFLVLTFPCSGVAASNNSFFYLVDVFFTSSRCCFAFRARHLNSAAFW